MNGKDLKERLVATGLSLSEIGRLVNMTPQHLNQALSATDIKTGLLERLARALGLPYAYFYGDSTPPAVVTANGDNSIAAANSSVSVGHCALLQKEIDHLKEMVEQKNMLLEEKERTINLLTK